MAQLGTRGLELGARDAQHADVAAHRSAAPDDQRDRRWLDALFQRAPALLAILRGRELVCELCTPAATALFGGGLVQGRSAMDATPGLQHQGFFELMRRVVETGEPFTGTELPAVIDRTGRGDLETAYFDLVLNPTHASDGEVEGLMLLGVEVTGEVRARRELEAALAVRDDFLAAASHELGTPLAIIELALHSVRRALEGRGQFDPAVAERLERARRAGRRLARVRDSLLEVSRQRAGRLELEPQDVRLDELVRAVVHDLSDVAARYGVALSVQAEEPLRARLDADRVAHALTGIVDNALKFGAGRPVLVRARGEGSAARIDVVDHGSGIGSGDQERIFEPFERAVTSRSFGGLGVGLWTARRILQASGGDVLVASAPGSGATFTIRLPLA